MLSASLSLLVFSSRLTEKECSLPGGIIHFTVMDHDLMWSNDFEGEAFLEICKLSGIPNELNNDNRPLDDLKQIELSLTHPKGTSRKKLSVDRRSNTLECFLRLLAVPSRIIEILEQRSMDRVATDFVRRRREVENQ